MMRHHTLQPVDTNTKMKLAVIATLIASTAAFSVSPKDLGQVRCRKSEEIASKKPSLEKSANGCLCSRVLTTRPSLISSLITT